MSLLASIQSLTKRFLKLRDFEFERHAFGESAVTTWRLKLRPKSGSTDAPKRLVIVPGFGDTPLSWLPVVSLLIRQKSFRERQFDEIVILEFSGHLGGHPSEPGIPSEKILHRAVKTIVDHLAPDTLVGQSMGGYLTATYASNLGDSQTSRLQNLVLLCPSGMALDGSVQQDWEQLMQNLFSGRTDPFVQRALGAPPNFAPLRRPYNWIAGEFRDFLSKKHTLELLLSFKDIYFDPQKVENIRVRTLLIWGENDPLIPFAASQIWRDRWTSSAHAPLQFVALPKIGHGIHVEVPLKTTRLIASFLADARS